MPDTVLKNSGRDKTANVSFLLFVAGGIVGLLQLMHPVEFGDGFEMVAIAKNLAEHGVFGNPFYIANTGPTAVVPPLYPFFLGGITKILRNQGLVVMVVTVVNILVNALIAASLTRVSLLFYGDLMPGISAAILWLACARLMPSWDTSYTVAGLILFCLYSASSMQRSSHINGSGALAGAFAGGLFLLNASSIMVSLPWTGYLLLRSKAHPKQALKVCILAAAGFILIALPWVLRNYLLLGAPVFRTNLGMTLYASNNDCAEATLLDDERRGCYQAYHPNTSATEAGLLRTLGEVEYDRMRIADAKSWMEAHPTRFKQLTMRRLWEFWFPAPGEHPYATFGIWVATALSLPGLVLMAIRREPVTLFFTAALLIYPLMYYVVVADVRYRYPVLWLSLLSAGYLTSSKGIGGCGPKLLSAARKIRRSCTNEISATILSGAGSEILMPRLIACRQTRLVKS